MKLLGFIALVLAAVNETTGQAWIESAYQPPEYIYAAANTGVKPFCRYVYWDRWHLRYGTYPDGTLCRLFPWRVGYCQRGRCTAKRPPIEIPCDRVHRGPGYATSCNHTCTQGFRSVVMPYEDGTPCLQIGANGRRAGPPGLCRSRMCNLIYEPTLEEDKLMHPAALLRCPEKEHTSRNILMSCYYYCNQNGTFYAGHYDSKPSSGCNLRKPTPEQPLGWCCRGDCIKKYNCQP
uniref:Basic tail secreted protein n=1 Tax=Rhipicephalus zambeziensis TaxID=60191 RepID=A0A224YGR7_9ACAR